MQKGIIISYVLVFGSIFLILLAALSGFILIQQRQSIQKIAWQESLEIAEAGINYYKWCLNNGVEADCQLQKTYYDSSGGVLGQFSLEIDSILNCGQITETTITSTGWTSIFPQIKRKVRVLYGRPTVAQYSYILNDNVWIGSDHEIRGPYHSNGGIRMDGENQSLVTSAKETWLCTSSFGCFPSEQKPGVFTTANGQEDLFDFPTAPFNFDGLAFDLSQMKINAQTNGVYLPPSLDINPQAKGYHLKFKNNNTFEAWIITNLSSAYAYSMEEGWHYDYFTISQEYLYQTVAVPSSCSVIFVEDNIFPEGTIKGKITLASANLINPNLDTDVILTADIDYVGLDGSSGLSLIGERNVLIGPQSPNQMELRGIFVAQKGRFSRNHYPNNIKEKLEISGSIISNGRVGTQWTSGGQIISGYRERESYFDSDLIYSAPPFTPNIAPDYKIVNWQEVE